MEERAVVRVDAHQHVWDIESGGYPTLAALPAPANRTYEPAELLPQLVASGIDATVLVQAEDHHEDTAAMLAHAREHDWIAGVVGWLPLLDPQATAARIADWAQEPLLVGMRHLIHDEPDPQWLLQPQVIESLKLLARAGIPYDVVAVLPEHLALVPRIARRVPGLKLVIDHLAKPPIAAGGWEPWATLLAEAAAVPGVHAKVSGLNTAADPQTWDADALRRYVDHALDCFGADRLMFGGDWPIARLAGEYADVVRETGALLADLPPADQAAIWGGTAERFYGLRIRGTASAAAAGAAEASASAEAAPGGAAPAGDATKAEA
ncbi:amidohydrolase family protein [Conexibacter sp. JD483]|uniref:amidohydrolase family protein n=1 Tax=unclassified Conexibacter TaxID=2627773 RepID=UPI0027260698|nr:MULTISPECIES: amidohydrolase family protein [unclassified Conexibacter]MDO8188188.1 amidohydrolase family protein [Conexibacter sp. CPCC 205706]MDO8201595.1 amidohydrolase family protein [Conexibacter sp. CPCC 205762]MDR9372377.1 amidohydrolase family protein [Conexibacter sp. JD483]